MQKQSPSLEAMLPPGIRSRMIAGVNGLDMHILEAGFEAPGRPLALLAHGYPELAFSWRHVMPPLAQAGYHVVAPDLRGFGRTTGGCTDYDCDLLEFGALNKVRDMLALVAALPQDAAEVIIGHDLGSHVVAWCALVRPDVFKSVVMMSAPFAGPPALDAERMLYATATLAADLAALPRPRKYYVLWNGERGAAADYETAPQGLHDFFRAYFHHKSGNWAGNKPFYLADQSAAEMARMPTYYVMDLDKGMAATVAAFMPTPEEIAACNWLEDDEVALFAAEYRHAGFQGALNASYRILSDPRIMAEMRTFAGRKIDVPSAFISGACDWGIYQTAGALQAMAVNGCSNMTDIHLVEGAGHWVQQERATEVTTLLLDFIGKTGKSVR
jgi:pimeloyl-ACP methyl ester carboxylesterase